MKKINYLFFILLIITACQEDPLTPYDDAMPNYTGDTYIPDDGGGGTTGGSFSVTVGSESWTADMVVANEMMGMISIVGTNNSSNSQVGITLNETTSVGTHNFDGFSITGVFTDHSTTPPTIYNASGPALEILSIDAGSKSVKGVFTFEAVNPDDSNDKVNITNGEFNITYKSMSF